MVKGGRMKLLLTSSGITNPALRAALVDLLGKPLEDASALVVISGIYPFAGGGQTALTFLRGEMSAPLLDIGWKSVGLLELTALPTIDRDVWTADVRAADAVLVWGGDPLYLSYWLRESGLAELLPSLPDTVYVGISAGAIATARTFGETYPQPPAGASRTLSSEPLVFATPDGEEHTTLVTAEGAGFVDFAIIPHLNNPRHPDASLPNAELWASKIPAPTYALDEQSAVVVRGADIDVVSEGEWRRFEPV
jgi:dipeptidase E